MQETARVNYVHYGKGSKKSRGKSRPSGSCSSSSGGSGSSVNIGKPSKPSGKVGKFHYPLTSVGDVAKGDTRKDIPVRQWKQFVEVMEQKDTMKKCV